jgi:D-aminoacyl-tRNA deacylase
VSVKLIVTSSEDNASMNIRARLLEKESWTEAGVFDTHPVLSHGDFRMVQVDRIHLEEDFIDERFEKAHGPKPEAVVFASRHRAESRIPTLTVHPVGNYSSADFGGRPSTLSWAHPGLMTSALRSLAVNAQGMGFSVSFETTHHGPLLSSPAFYIEIGSYEELWGREDAAEAIAASILAIRDDGYPKVIGVGGGHYAPRFTDIALGRKVAIGHMAANYALDSLDDEKILQMSEKSGGAKLVYFHKKSMPKQKYRELRERFSTLGIKEISSEDLEPL